jgi:4'-phosphopantetheinyl transferase
MERIDPGEVHVWRIPLDRDPGNVRRATALISPDEIERMLRFRFDVHRDRFALRRAGLRILLARYLDIEPDRVGFTFSPRGKPEIATPDGDPGLRFNLSDSADLALVGIVRGRRIGVDVEHARRVREMDSIARRHFSPREYEEYLKSPPSGRTACFYNAWTRKEAWLKARGDGLWAGLSGFDVTLAAGSEPRLRVVHGEPGEAERWRLHAFTPAPGYVAAVAVDDPDARFVDRGSGGA